MGPVAFTVGAFAVVVVAVAIVLSGDVSADPRGAVVLAGVPLVLALAAIVVRTRLQVRRESAARVRLTTPAESTAAGLALPHRRDLRALWSFVAAYLGAAGLLLFAGGITLVSRGANGWFAIVLGLAGIASVAVGARGRRRPRPVVLTPDALVDITSGHERRAAWSDVLAVGPAAGPTPAVLVTVARSASPAPTLPDRRPHRRLGSAAERLAPHLVIDASGVDLDPALLLETIRFYAAHPDARTELGTQSAVDRVRRGDVLGR